MRASVLSVIVLAAVACGGKKDPAKAPPTPTGSATPTDPGKPGADPAAGSAAAPLPPPSPVDQAAVDALVDEWLAAQNGGDFAAYEGLYAKRMEGVKRVGPRAWRFDRAGWMKDRKKMFAKPMVVTATERQTAGSARTAFVEFTQTYQQARFADSGRKRMVLVSEDGRYRIAREEMLASTVGAPPAATADAIVLTVKVDNRWFAVLAADADDAWATGAISGPFQGPIHRYALRAATAAPTAGSWLGKGLAVYAADGKRCDATIASLHLLGGGTPHFGDVQLWDGGGEDFGGDGHVFSPAERARAIYDMGPRALVGELTITGDCAPAYAADPTRAITPLGAVAVDAATTAKALAAFRALPSYKTIATDFAANDGAGEWAPNPIVAAFGPADHPFIVVTAFEGAGCGGFSGSLAAVFEASGGALTLRSSGTDGHVEVAAAVDSDGDGAPELIGTPPDLSTITAHLRLGPSGFVTGQALTMPFNDCGC